MAAHKSRFELVKSKGEWFARFIAGNGREVWRTSETYKRRAAAVRAIELTTAGPVTDDGVMVVQQDIRIRLEVREVSVDG